MRRWPGLVLAAALVTAGCASAPPPPSPTPTPSPAPTASPASTPSPTSSPAPSADPFAGLAYRLDLPAGWTIIDASGSINRAALDAFVSANPGFAAAIQAFEAMPDARLAVNSLLGDALVSIQLPSQGLPLATVGQGLTAQFLLVPGVVGTPVATQVTLPVGDALHWVISLRANKVGGGTIEVEESVYLVVSDTTAILVEFVIPGGGVAVGEERIIDSLRLQP